MNNSISPRVTAWHPSDLESGDSGAVETRIKHCMDPKARFTPKMAKLALYMKELSQSDIPLWVFCTVYIPVHGVPIHVHVPGFCIET